MCVMSTVPTRKRCYRAALQALSLLGQEIPWVQHFSVITWAGDLAQEQQRTWRSWEEGINHSKIKGLEDVSRNFPKTAASCF